MPPRPDAPGLLEEFLVGEEHTFDSVHDRRPHGVGVASRTTGRRRSRCCATRGSSGPCCSPATSTARVRRDPRRRARGRAGARRARRAHAHGVVPPPRRLGRRLRGRRPAAGRADRHDARVRPRRRLLPGVVRAGGPRPVRRRLRAKYAAGCAYLRGQGRGRVRAVHGVDELQRELGHLVVEAKLPEPGQPASIELRGRGLRDRARPGHRGRRATRSTRIVERDPRRAGRADGPCANDTVPAHFSRTSDGAA